MPLEDLEGDDVFIKDLVPANPTTTDDRMEGDNHIGGIKNVLKNSFEKISGPVTADHTELSYCEGVTSAIQTQIDGKADDGDFSEVGHGPTEHQTEFNQIGTNTTNIGLNEGRITALEQAGGVYAPLVGVGFNNQTTITSSSAFQPIAGASVTTPAAWGAVAVKVDANINITLAAKGTLPTTAVLRLLAGDLEIWVNGVSAAAFWACTGIQAMSPPNTTEDLIIEGMVSVSAVLAVVGGQSIDIRGKKSGLQGVASNMRMNINANAVYSSMTVMPVTVQ